MTEKQSLGSLNPSPKNPRTLSKKKAEMLTRTLAEFGDIGGIVYNRRSDCVVSGHQRRTAFLKLKASDINIETTYDPPTKSGTVAEGYILLEGEKFSYRVVDWDASTENAANLASNKQAGDWDMPQLKEMLTELSELPNFDISLTMFSETEINGILETDVGEIDSEPNLGAQGSFKIVIECEGELQQAVLLKNLREQGVRCKSVTN